MTAPPHAALVGAPSKPRPAPTAQPPAWARRAAPVLLIALTSALAGYRLGAKSLWHDEAFSLALARSDADTFWRALRDQESFAGLYYSILRVLPMLGDSEATLRLPSVVFAVLATVTCFAVGSRLFGFGVGIAAAVLLDVNLLFLRYAQEARPYALALWLDHARRLAADPGRAAAHVAELAGIRRDRGAGRLCPLLRGARGGRAPAVARRAPIAGPVAPGRRLPQAMFAVLVLPLSVVLLSTNAGGRPLLAQALRAGPDPRTRGGRADTAGHPAGRGVRPVLPRVRPRRLATTAGMGCRHSSAGGTPCSPAGWPSRSCSPLWCRSGGRSSSPATS